MTGGITRRSRVGGESRFYSPPAMRLQNQGLQQQQQQQKLGVGSSRRSGSGSVSGSDDGTSASSSSTKTPHTAGTTASLSSPRVENSTNLDRFIEHTTPTVPAQFFSKTNMREWKNHADEPCPYFVLGDLWESLKEWSAYGAGVPLVLNESDSVIQYYVPYLSGIQLYVNPSKPVIRQRRPGEESDAESSRETSSDDSGDLATDGQQRCSMKKRQGLNGISITNGPNGPLMGLPGDENETANPPGILVFEYMERDQPYSRVPLSDKVLGLTSQFPELKAYKSCDLTSASWLSVAWYPIYRIPIGPTLQSLDACFLTYHSLSTPLSNTCTDGSNFHGLAVSGKLQDCMSSMPGKMSLPTFGLASYKFKISFWSRNGDYESQNLSSLVSTADKWNRLLQVNHPDYAFFVSHNSYWW